MKVALVLPAYNESLAIADMIRSFHAVSPELHIYVIDNNSTDGTGAIAEAALKEVQAKGRVLREHRQGKGFAIRQAFAEIDADYYVMCDADCTYYPEDLPRLMEPMLANQADMVVGDRHSSGDYHDHNTRMFHGVGNSLVKHLVNKLFGAKLNDIMTGYRVFTRQFVKNYPISCSGFELETEMTVHALGHRFRIVEVPISYRERPNGGVSKLNTFRDGFKVLKFILLVFKDYKPLEFFGIIAAILSLCGLATGTPVIVEYMQTKWVSHVPLAILATGLMILSLLMVSVGLILDTVVKYHKADYELRLLRK